LADCFNSIQPEKKLLQKLMDTQSDQLLKETEAYIISKNKLDILERRYNVLYATCYLQERILGFKTEEMRKQEMIRIMENEHQKALDELMELQGIVREHFYRMEALSIILGKKK